MGNDNLLTLEQSAKYLGCSIRTVQRYILAGKIIPHKKTPKYTRLTKMELDRYKEVYR